MADYPPNPNSVESTGPGEVAGNPRPAQDAEGALPESALQIQLDLPAGTQLEISVTAVPEENEPRQTLQLDLDSGALPQRWSIDANGAHPGGRKWRAILAARLAALRRVRGQAARTSIHPPRELSNPLYMGLFCAALLVYLATRLFRLSEYPIYFFTDEAIHTVLASDFLRDGLRDYNDVLLPTYFKNAALYNLSLSVYLQILPTLLFGKSVFVTRAVSVLVSASGAAAVSLTLKDAFQLKNWWCGVLVLAIALAWFLHSRTAFETVLMVSFYAWCLYFYLRYRQGSPRFLYASIAFGALAFYSYNGGQIILIATAAVLLFSDLRYHLQHRRMVGRALLLGVLCALPYLRFQYQNPGETAFHLKMLNAYWLGEDLPLLEKLRIFSANYLQGLSPRYWFFPHEVDLTRHLMNGYGHILWPLLPFLLLGAGYGIVHIKEHAYRDLILVTLLSPLGGALVGIGITRNLVFLVPASIWIGMGIEQFLKLIRREKYGVYLSLILFTILTGTTLWLTQAALTQGPLWEHDYGLGGMQYGAAQVYSTAEEKLATGTYDLVYVTPTWANGADILRRFFLPDDVPVYLGNTHGFLESYHEELNERLLFFLTASEYEELQMSEKITDIHLDEVIPYPDGSPGFYLVSMRYAEGVEEIFAAEQALRELPVTDQVEVGELAFEFQHPPLDMGELQHMFDGDTFTMARVDWGNPALFVISFDRPEELTGLTLTTGSMNFDLAVTITLADGSERTLSESFQNLPDDPTVSIAFGETPMAVSRIAFEIFNPIGGEAFKIHLREIALDR